MNRAVFDILTTIDSNDNFINIAELQHALNERFSISEAIRELDEDGLIFANNNGYSVTSYGYQELEPYRVKRAIFLAAGFGSRMKPITINTPKPMVRVHGKRIIETILDAVLALGVDEIYIVRGYLGEEFDLLLKKYPMIRFIENPVYDHAGTIASFYYSRHLLQNTYVLESDLVVNNPKALHKYHYTSDFMGTKVDKTEDWFFKTKEDGTITEIGVNGEGESCYQLIGISYWDSEAGKKLENDIEEAYNGENGMKLPMSYVPFRVYPEHYNVSIMPCGKDDIIEIDSFVELQNMDNCYR